MIKWVFLIAANLFAMSCGHFDGPRRMVRYSALTTYEAVTNVCGYGVKTGEQADAVVFESMERLLLEVQAGKKLQGADVVSALHFEPGRMAAVTAPKSVALPVGGTPAFVRVDSWEEAERLSSDTLWAMWIKVEFEGIYEGIAPAFQHQRGLDPNARGWLVTLTKRSGSNTFCVMEEQDSFYFMHVSDGTSHR